MERRPLIWAGLTLTLLFGPLVRASAQEPDTKNGIPYIKARPLPGGNLKVFEDFGRLLRDPLKRAKMLSALRERIVPVRATFVPKPPFDPRFPKHVHGIAFITQTMEREGTPTLTWLTSSGLIRDASYLSMKTKTGKWARVRVKQLCDDAPLAQLDVDPDVFPTDQFSTSPIATRGLPLASKSLLAPGIPVLALRKLESDYPAIDTANLETEDEIPVADAWQVTKNFPNGTPLLTANGAVLLVVVQQGLARFAVFPPEIKACPKPAPTKKPEETP